MNLDYYLFQQINGFAGRWPWLDWLGIFAASYLQYIVVAGFLLFLFWGKSKEGLVKKYYLAGAAIGAIIFSRAILTEIIRWVWFRPRPFIDHAVNSLIAHANTGSFPSGHAAFFFALATVVYLYNKKLGIWFYFFSVPMVISRVFVGVHYPSDILAGALIGIFCGWLVYYLFNQYQNKKAR